MLNCKDDIQDVTNNNVLLLLKKQENYFKIIVRLKSFSWRH